MVQKATTICAPATGGGGAIAMIRVSGPETIEIISEIFKPADNKIDISTAKGYTIFYGDVSSQGEMIDEVLVHGKECAKNYTTINYDITGYG